MARPRAWKSDPAFGQMCAWVVFAARRCDTLAELEAAARALPTWYSPRVEVLDRICDRAAGHGSPDAVHRLITWLETNRPSTEKWRDLVAAGSRLDVKHPAVTTYRWEQECLAGVARRQEQQLARDRFVEAWSAGGPVARLVSAAQQDAFPVRWLPDEWAAVGDADLAAVSDETLTALIGRLVPTRKGPWRALRRKAATEDPRFAPLSSQELADLELEISVLSPLNPVQSIDEIVVGKHGLIVDAGYTRGLLLPHVATEYAWSREEFLSHTCVKAGLSASRC